jgi:hypothetical protein
MAHPEGDRDRALRSQRDLLRPANMGDEPRTKLRDADQPEPQHHPAAV